LGKKLKKPSRAVSPTPGKMPFAASAPDVSKIPRSVEGTSYHHLRPSWRVSSMEMVDPFGWHRLDGPTLRSVRERLSLFETMSWSEILVASKKQNHSIHVQDLAKRAQDRLDEMGIALDEVVSLRLSGKERVFGYLENGVLVLLWWDPDHEVCPSVRG
jgi:hypothetical protein